MPKGKKTEQPTSEPLQPVDTAETITESAVAVAEPVEAQPERVQYVVERSAEVGAMPATKMPDIRAGVCEFCGPGEFHVNTQPGVLKEDWSVDPDTQIGRCAHYKGTRIRCSYCPAISDWKDNIRQRAHKIWVSPWNQKELIICCADVNCRDKHLKRARDGK